MNESKFHWKVEFSNAAKKGRKDLPDKIRALLDALVKEIEVGGPIRKDWPNFSKLSKGPRIPDGTYHCHLKKGKPTYVACWNVRDKKINFVEMIYAGTHEKAPY